MKTRRVLSGVALTIAALTVVADEHMPNPGGGGGSCVGSVNVSACSKAGAPPVGSNNTTGCGGVFYIANPNCPVTIPNAATGKDAYSNVWTTQCDWAELQRNASTGNCAVKPGSGDKVTVPCRTNTGNDCPGPPGGGWE